MTDNQSLRISALYNNYKLCANLSSKGDQGRLYDDRLNAIKQALRDYISKGGPYNGQEALSMIDQYNEIITKLADCRDDWLNNYVHTQDSDPRAYRGHICRTLRIIDLDHNNNPMSAPPLKLLNCYREADDEWWCEAYAAFSKPDFVNNPNRIVDGSVHVYYAVRTWGGIYYRANDWDDAMRMVRELFAAHNNGICGDLQDTDDYQQRSDL